jgi:hypothetical protein
MRPIADEIVLAVDKTSGRETLDACAGLADRRFELESARIGCYLGWIFNQCSGDWILRLDEDEIPSQALLDRLPELIQDPRPTNILMSRRWLYPDSGRFITNHPWTPDYQVQLIKNVPGIWRTTGVLHEPIHIFGEQKLVDLPIYHCPCILLPLSVQRERRRRYDEKRPGLEIDGFPINAMHTPQDCRGIVTAPVPAADRSVIDAILDAAEPPAGSAPPLAPVRAVPFREASQFYEGRKLSDDAYHARVRFLEPWLEMPAGSSRRFEVLVENLGDATWPWGEQSNPPVRLGYQWLDPQTRETLLEGRTAFGESVFPGRATRLFMVVNAPALAGRYILQADVAHDHVRWFGCGVEREMLVTEPIDSSPKRRRWRPRRFRRRQVSARQAYRPSSLD